MKTTVIRIATVLALGLSLAACERHEGPGERAGRKVDEMRPGTQDSREAADKTKDKLDDAGHDIKRETKDATK